MNYAIISNNYATSLQMKDSIFVSVIIKSQTNTIYYEIKKCIIHLSNDDDHIND